MTALSAQLECPYMLVTVWYFTVCFCH